MADKADLIAFIRFQIEQLGTRNGQHEFEELSRHLARARIGQNLLAATGPVAAGGDQGRDFETFEPVGPTTRDLPPSVFGCSLQKDFASKLRSDLKSAAMSGKPFERFYFFSGVDIPVATRHKLRDESKLTHGVEVEIIDAHNIAEMLASPDVFWIAERYLHVPASQFPRPRDEADWYAKLFKKWKNGDGAKNYAGLTEVRAATRHATWDKELKVDLNFWITELEHLREAFDIGDFKRIATYEISVAALRGQGTLVGREDELRTYFDDIAKRRGTNDLENGITLLAYVMAAAKWGHANFTAEELLGWRSAIIVGIDERIASAEHPNILAPLLELRGFAASTIMPGTRDLPDFNAAIEWWNKLEEEIPRAPLYPVTTFADRLTQFLKLPGPKIEILAMAQRLDEHVATRMGDYAAGQKSRDRAIVLLEQEDRVGAIEQLHVARERWLKGETVYGSLLSSLLLSQAYRQLGMYYAAKFHALGAAKLALHSRDPKAFQFTPRALKAALESDYLAGSWDSFLRLVPLTLNVNNKVDDEGGHAFDTYHDVVFMTLNLHALSEAIDPSLGAYVAEWTKHWHLEEYYSESMPIARGNWRAKTRDELRGSLEAESVGEPFADLRDERRVKWRALGIDWSVTWRPNEPALTARAEEFLAFLQILLVDLSRLDLFLIPTRARITLKEGASTTIRPIPGNRERNWLVTLGTGNNDDDGLTPPALASVILSEVSLLPFDDFMQALEGRFQEGLSTKMSIASTYREIYAEFVTVASPRPPAAIPTPIGVRPQEAEQLSWHSTRLPGYTREKADMILGNRYRNTVKVIRLTMKRIREAPELQERLLARRGQGWLDWQIYAVVAMIALNYRARHQGATTENEVAAAIRAQWNEEERDDAPEIPPSEFSDENFDRYFKVMVVSSFPSLGLQCRQETPDFDSIIEFLRRRVAYFQEDVPHEDLLGNP